MEVLAWILVGVLGWFSVDTKLELEELRDQPPRIERVVEIQEVLVPVAAKCPEPDLIPPPELAINDLTEEDRGNFGKVADAYVLSLTACMSYAEQQKIILDGYRATDETLSESEKSHHP